MRYNKDVTLLKKLVEIPSPSGFENKLSEYIKSELLRFLPKSRIEIDFHNNVIATIPGKTNKIVMLDAHQDMLGFLISNIDKDGYISLEAIGGHDLSLLRGRKVLVNTNKVEMLKGVIGSKPIHLMGDVDDEIPNQACDVSLDLGTKKRKEIISRISIGDPVVLQPEFDNLSGEYYTGSGFDDKAGCYILLEIVRTLITKRIKPSATLKIVFSTQEEVGCKGAKEVAYRIRPDLFIGIDVTFATDQPDVSEKEVGRCVLGQGLAIYKGVNIHYPSVNMLSSVAKNQKINVQYLATGGNAGTNAKSVASICGGTKIIDLGIPLRNMHSPVEIINLKDLRSGTKLLIEFLTHKRLNSVIEK